MDIGSEEVTVGCGRQVSSDKMRAIGQGHRQELAVVQLPNILILAATCVEGAGLDGKRVATATRIGSRVVLGVGDIERSAVLADAHRGRIPAGWDKAEVLAVLAAHAELDHRNRVGAPVGHEQRALVGRQGK